MTDADAHEPAPSEVLGPDQLDQALLTIVVRRDGSTVMFVASDTDRAAVATWMRQAANQVETAPIDCAACRDGQPHAHVTE